MYTHLLSLAAVASCAVSAQTVQPQAISKYDVDRAIARISTELINRFDQHAGWEPTQPDSGWLSKGHGSTTAIATLALLSANQSRHSTLMTTALQHLESLRMPSTYTCALRTMIWCELSSTHGKQLNRTGMDSLLFATVGKGRIIFLGGYVRQALLGQPAWGVHGYDTKTAMTLLNTLVKNHLAHSVR